MSGGPKTTKATLISCLGYADAEAAVDWLCRAFGFEPYAVYRDGDGKVVHAELSFGNGMIMIGPSGKSEFGKTHMATPGQIDGRQTQTVYAIVEDPDGHHDKAVAEGAEIVLPLKDADYGGRGYTARDPEGYIWSFGTYDPWTIKQPA